MLLVTFMTVISVVSCSGTITAVTIARTSAYPAMQTRKTVTMVNCKGRNTYIPLAHGPRSSPEVIAITYCKVNMKAIVLTASGEKSFENVDGRRTDRRINGTIDKAIFLFFFIINHLLRSCFIFSL